MIKYEELKIENGINFVKDLGSLTECEDKCFEYPFDKKDLWEMCYDNTIIVAKEDEKVVGYIAFKIKEHQVYINKLCVLSYI